MAHNEDLNPRDDLGPDQIGDDNYGPDQIGDDDFVLDGELKEIQAQLESDAQHLQSIYPPGHSGKLDQLVERCLVASQDQDSNDDSEWEDVVPRHLVSPAAGDEKTSTSSSSTKPTHRPNQRFIQFASAVCVATLLIGSFSYLWNRPDRTTVEKPVVSNDIEQDTYLFPAVAVSSMPPELMNASAPELEALYDEMPSESVSIEY